MGFAFLFYIFLLINVEVNSLKTEKSFYINAKGIFTDYTNYFVVFFVVIAASGFTYLFERVYDHFFNVGLGLLRNNKFQQGLYFLKNQIIIIMNQI